MTSPDPTTPLDPEKIAGWQRRAVAWFNANYMAESDDEPTGARAAYLLAQHTPTLLAALAEAQRERDEERRKVEALLLGDKALQPRIWLGEDVQRLKAELADLSNLLDQTMAARDQLRQERNAAAEESRLMRPVVEKAREWRHTPVAGWRSADGDEMALVAAVDTYEKQTGGTE